MFIGREKELAQLESAYSGERFQFFAVTGQKGAGKTTLLEEFCRNKAAIYFTVSQGSGRANLKNFSDAVLNHYDDKKHSQFQFWDNALGYIAMRQADYRVILVIDGFDILAERDSVFAEVFAKVAANEMKSSSIFLVVTCEDAEFLVNSPLLRLVTGTIRLGKFLTEENMTRLKREEMSKSQAHPARSAKFFRVPADRVILREGIMNPDMYKIVSGRAVCYANYGKDDEIVLGTLKEGHSLGEYSLITGKPGIYTAVAFTDMLLLRVNGADFEAFTASSPENSLAVMRSLAAMAGTMRANISMMNSDIQSLSENRGDIESLAARNEAMREKFSRSIAVIRAELDTMNSELHRQD